MASWLLPLTILPPRPRLDHAPAVTTEAPDPVSTVPVPKPPPNGEVRWQRRPDTSTPWGRSNMLGVATDRAVRWLADEDQGTTQLSTSSARHGRAAC